MSDAWESDCAFTNKRWNGCMKYPDAEEDAFYKNGFGPVGLYI